MPTYQYSCTDCGHFFEQVQSFSEDSLTVCPECEGKLRKVFNAVGVVFKGSGFYRNDSRSGSGEGKGSDAGGSDKGGSEKSGSEKSESTKSSDKGTEKKSGTTSEKKSDTSSSSGSGSGSGTKTTPSKAS